MSDTPAAMVPLLAALLTLFCASSLSAFQQNAGAPPGTRTGYAKVGEARLYYEEKGEGPTLIMAHGGWLDTRMWDGQFEVFARSCRVIRYDAREHGRSAGVSGRFSHAEDLAGLMDALQIRRAVIMGLSMGGRTAIDLAIAHPERVAALILAAPGISGYPFDSPELKKNSQFMREAAAKGDMVQYVEYFQRSWTDGPRRSPADVDPAIREKVRQMALNSLKQRHPDSRAYELEPPALGRLGEIKAPTLAVVGELDMPDILDIVDRIRAAVPGARKVVIPGAAHMVNMEKPQEFNSAVQAFLMGVAKR